MEPRAPVERSHVVNGATPREVYDVVVDFESYPRLFPEIKAARVLERRSSGVRVEFRADVVLSVRYVLDLVCDAEALSIDWTYVEGDVVADSVGSWRFHLDDAGTKLIYRVSMMIKAPLPAFVVRKATDALVAASIPGMFASIDRETRTRRAARAGAGAG
jgi:ribosome-associated toxin RatA of RatAB toxin-antitoxin module